MATRSSADANAPSSLCGGITGGDEQDLLEPEGVAGRLARPRDARCGSDRTCRRTRRCRRATGRPRSGAVMAHRSASQGSAPTRARSRRSGRGRRARCRPAEARRRCPCRARSRWKRSADSSTSKFVWAATPLDPPAADPEGAVLVALDAEPVLQIASIRWTTTPAGSGGSARLVGGRQQAGEPGRNSASPVAVDAEIATTRRPCFARARGRPATPRPPRGRSILLKATRIGLSRSAGSWASSSSRITSWSHAGIAPGAVHEVDEEPGPLDVAQERVPEAGPARRALDEPRDIGDRRAASSSSIAEVHHAEVGLEGGERVVGDLRAWPRSGRPGAWTCPRWAARRGRCRRSAAAPGGASALRPARPSGRAWAPGGSTS